MSWQKYVSHMLLLKYLYDQIFDTYFFAFSYTVIFSKDLAKFQSITNIRTYVFLELYSENLRLPLMFLVPSLG